MRGDLNPVAFALAQKLGARTVEARERSRDTDDQGRQAASRRAVLVKGVHYASITEAGRTMRVSAKTIYRMMDRAEAEYA